MKDPRFKRKEGDPNTLTLEKLLKAKKAFDEHDAEFKENIAMFFPKDPKEEDEFTFKDQLYKYVAGWWWAWVKQER